MKKVLLYIETAYAQDAIHLMEVARQLYKDAITQTYALVLNGDTSCVLGICDVVLNLVDDALHPFDQKGIGDVVTELYNRYHFDAILFLATPMGRCIAPAVAMSLGTGLVADVTRIAHGSEGLELIRPAYSGKIMAGIRITGDGPIMMSVRSGIFTYTPTHVVESTRITLEGLSYRYASITVTDRKEKKVPYDIRDSEVLISGGAGVHAMQDLEELATLLKGKVSASRAVVDQGKVSRAMQVGQSGKTVSPTLYIALGIHGAIQHVVGLKDVSYIISVNTNRNAPICSISDIVVEGDALTFVQGLVKRIKKGQQLCM